MFKKFFEKIGTLIGRDPNAQNRSFSLQEVQRILDQHHAALLELYGVPIEELRARLLRHRILDDTSSAGNSLSNSPANERAFGGDWAIFTPLPPTTSGISDYAAELAPSLASRLNATYIIADDAPAPDPNLFGFAVQRLSEWKSNQERDRATPRLYHLGNSSIHDYILQEAMQQPGVVVLHDRVLHHLFEQTTLRRGDSHTFKKFALEHHGPLGAMIADLAERELSGDAFRFGLPLSAPALQNATAVIVHSFEAMYQFRDLLPDILVQRIPLQYSRATPLTEMNASEVRKRLGMHPDRLIFVALGLATVQKRLDSLISALGAIQDQIPPFELWVVGELPDSLGLRELAIESGLANHMHVTGRVDMDTFQAFIDHSDVVVNLRFPSAGESSATLIRAMGAGKPCVVFDYGTALDYPDGTLVRIPLEVSSHTGLANSLRELACDENARRQTGAAAAEYIARWHEVDQCADSYAKVMLAAANERDEPSR
ncbi:glycosyltransferase family 4 protein [Rhodopirellula sp. P2]|uniref:glycosyltransferase family 4 protein n=1 Tax=Rhodopirellula sp. P2 TaxID=2127060 RepID=UPI002367F6D2|nr:glycosyltransferase family 4 protein [Rhodopirellula sp. P2]WDQ17789.1 glycosyltransferase family 4 protein [Rhodopirellula sp. P2]